MRKLGNFAGLFGILMILSVSLIYLIKGQVTTQLMYLLWGGFLFVLIFLYSNFGNLRNILLKRSTKYGANMAVMLLIFLAIVTIISVISTMHKKRMDLTKSGRYTLSDQTIKIIKSLKRDVEVISFYRQDQRTRQQMVDLLQEYAYNAPRFHYQIIDPDRSPDKALKYGVTEYRATLIKSGNNQEKVGFESEDKITNAILKVMKDDIKTIYFLKGHGENDISSSDKDGYKAAKEALEKENYKVKELLLLSEPGVPEDASVLVIGGSKKELISEELPKLIKYIEQEGNVLFLIDPGSPPGLVNLLKGYGFNIGDDIIIDKLSQVFGANYLTPVVTDYHKEHPLTRDFKVSTFYPLARSVGIEENPKKGSYVLATTSDNSWAETSLPDLEQGKAQFDDGKDKAGPVGIAAVTVLNVKDGQQNTEVKSTKNLSKVVVFGDSDFANNTHINLAGNGDMFLNTVNWLAEEAELISIRRRNPDNTPVVLTSAQSRIIFWLPVIVLPSLVIVAGISIINRKRWGG